MKATVSRYLLTLFSAAAVMPAMAMNWQYDNFDMSKRTCRLVSWGGKQPSSGKLKLHDTYTLNDVAYTVTEIAPHALDHLTEVTSIEIPASIVKIGAADSDNPTFGVENFEGCPKLEKFVVAPGNSMFAATNAGILVSKDVKCLYRVPQAINLSTGALGLSSSVEYIGARAFAGNTTVKSMTLPKTLQRFSTDNGVMEMTALEELSCTGNERYVGRDGVLYNKKSNELIAYPVARAATSYSLYESTKSIGAKAFARSRNLRSVTIPATVTSMGESAFARVANLKSVKIPSSVTSMGDSIFLKCPALSSITIEGNVVIPHHFAYGCESLSEVKMPAGAPSKVLWRAFAHCKSLSDFPLSGTTEFSGDSIFADCGFTAVVYDSKPVNEKSSTGFYQFADCKNLTKIDMSAITLPGESSYYSLAPGLAAGCPRLTVVSLPSNVSFSGTAGYVPTFGENSSITKVVMGAFVTVPGSKIIGYLGGTTVRTPHVYAAVKGGNGSSQIPFSMLFGSMGGARIEPTIFCDLYTPSEYDKANDRYVFKGASYYIPGATRANYSEASAAGCHLEEMYDISINNADGYTQVKCVSLQPNVTINRVMFNNMASGSVDENGYVDIPNFPFDQMKNIQVYYTVSGVEMMTDYPGISMIPSGVEGIAADDSQTICPAEYYNLQGQKVVNPVIGRVYIVRRGSRVTKEVL